MLTLKQVAQWCDGSVAPVFANLEITGVSTDTRTIQPGELFIALQGDSFDGHIFVRQALEKMEISGFPALPILNKHGEYRGTLTEGDLLWAMKNLCYMDMRQAEARRIMEITRRKDHLPVKVTANMHDLVQRASSQNFVPVVDDKDAFIGRSVLDLPVLL